MIAIAFAGSSKRNGGRVVGNEGDGDGDGEGEDEGEERWGRG